MISVNRLSFRYSDSPVLSDVTFHIPEGALCALYGPNGSGKSTLLNCCLGLLKGYSGEISIGGQKTSTISHKEFAKLAAYVPQGHSPTFPFTVFEIVLMGRNPHIEGNFGPNERDEALTDDLLNRMGIDHLRNRMISELSGGELQMVSLARALNQDTPILMLDEPSSALDFHHQLELWRHLGELAESGKTIVITTHDPNHVLWYCSQAIILNNYVVAAGCPKDVICEDNLSRLYGSVSKVRECEGRTVVLPR